MRKNRAITLLVLIYLLIPVIFTVLYSLTYDWQNTLMPGGVTIKHYVSLFTNPRFYFAILRSVVTAVLAIVINFVILMPVLYQAKMHYPVVDRILRPLAMVPFAISGVILAVGLLKMYAVVLSGSAVLLIAAYSVVILPFMYQGIRNTMDNLNLNALVYAAQTLGASEWQAFWQVVFPNLLKGVRISVLLSFALLMGEFVLANILVGGNYETVQVFMYWSRGVSGHYSSAIVTVYFLLVAMVSMAASSKKEVL